MCVSIFIDEYFLFFKIKEPISNQDFFEQMLNSLLDNKHPDEKGRPALKPGFKLIGTQNGIQQSA